MTECQKEKRRRKNPREQLGQKTSCANQGGIHELLLSQVQEPRVNNGV